MESLLIFVQTTQMSMKKVLKMFGDFITKAIHKKTKQLYDQKVPITVDPSKLFYGSRSAALEIYNVYEYEEGEIYQILQMR